MRIKISLKAFGKSLSIVGMVVALSPDLYRVTADISPYLLFEKGNLLISIGRALFFFGIIFWLSGNERKGW